LSAACKHVDEIDPMNLLFVGREQAQRGDRGREDIQPVVTHETSRGSDARI